MDRQIVDWKNYIKYFVILNPFFNNSRITNNTRLRIDKTVIHSQLTDGPIWITARHTWFKQIKQTLYSIFRSAMANPWSISKVLILNETGLPIMTELTTRCPKPEGFN